MSVRYRLHLDHDGIALHRGGDPEVLAHAALDATDFDRRLAEMRGRVLEDTAPRAPAGARVLAPATLVLPDSQILYTEVPASGLDRVADEARVLTALEGATPYALDELVWDWRQDGAVLRIAVVARETIAEAEGFAEAHGFEPAGFLGSTGEASFPGTPVFRIDGTPADGIQDGFEPDSDPPRDTQVDPHTDVAVDPAPASLSDADATRDAPAATSAAAAAASATAARDEAAAPERVDAPDTAEAAPAPAVSGNAASAGTNSPPMPPDKAISPEAPDTAPAQSATEAADAAEATAVVAPFTSVRAAQRAAEAAQPASARDASAPVAPLPAGAETPAKEGPRRGGLSRLLRGKPTRGAPSRPRPPDAPASGRGAPSAPRSAPPAPASSAGSAPALRSVPPGAAPTPAALPATAGAGSAPRSGPENTSGPTQRLAALDEAQQAPDEVVPPAKRQREIRRRRTDRVVPAPVGAAPSATTPMGEAESLTVFGARRASTERARTPRFLGVALTLSLVAVMALVAFWSLWFGEARAPDTALSAPEAPAIGALGPVSTGQSDPPAQAAADEPGADARTASAPLSGAAAFDAPARAITPLPGEASDTAPPAPLTQGTTTPGQREAADAGTPQPAVAASADRTPSAPATEAAPAAGLAGIAPPDIASPGATTSGATTSGTTTSGATTPELASRAPQTSPDASPDARNSPDIAALPQAPAAPSPTGAAPVQDTALPQPAAPEGAARTADVGVLLTAPRASNAPQVAEVPGLTSAALTPPGGAEPAPIRLPNRRLPDAARRDALPGGADNPLPRGSFLGPDGLVVPLPEGALAPGGYALFTGPPPILPPARPGEDPQSGTDPGAAASGPDGPAPEPGAGEAIPEAQTAPPPSGIGPEADTPDPLAEARPRPRPEDQSTLETPEAAPDPALEPEVAGDPDAAEAADPPVAQPALAGIRPRGRPADLGAAAAAVREEAARADTVAREQAQEAAAALAEAEAQNAAEAEAAAARIAEDTASATALAVARAPEPRARPSNMAQIAARAQRQTPQPQPQEEETTARATPQTPPPDAAVQTAAASAAAGPAPSAPLVRRADRVRPAQPSSALVARQATQRNALRLTRVTLIGVYGSASQRRALVRLPSGRYVKVQVGDRLDGGQVSAISGNALQYTKSGQAVTLEMPSG